jgi:transcriptional regulator with XRE-family HTH domain
MKLNAFGHALRVGRAKVGKTMKEMADEMGAKPAFLSAMETGRSKIPRLWVKKIDTYFRDLGSPIEDLAARADASNKNVSIEGLPLQHQLLVSGFAKSELTPEQLEAAAEFLQNLHNSRKGKNAKK